MSRFFLESIGGDTAVIIGDDAKHISKVLRMQPGREITVSDTRGTDYLCKIQTISADAVTLEILSSSPCPNETTMPIKLYQAIPKGDKLEFVVQKAVELGAWEITPVLTSRCISQPSNRAMDKKITRLQRIAYEAAKQSGRGIIPQVNPLVRFEEAVEEMVSAELCLLLYEESTTPIGELIKPAPASVALMVGSEGGFSQAEADYAAEQKVQTASLGGRILRCETAPVVALSVLLYQLGEL